MPEFILFRAEQSLGPSFNEAARRLSENAAVTIKRADDMGKTAMILIEADPKALVSVQNDLPGWSIEPNRKLGHY